MDYKNIKFRAWHKEQNKMFEVLVLDMNSGEVFLDGFTVETQYKGQIQQESMWVPVDEVELMMYTGQQDKYGKDIYEGDIVQLDYITTSGKHRIGLSFEVKWCTQEGCWVGWDGFVENTLQQTRKMFVVKGNIHDNPELLKGEAE